MQETKANATPNRSSVPGSGTAAGPMTVTWPFCNMKSPLSEDNDAPLSVRKAFDSVSGEIPTANAWNSMSTMTPLGASPVPGPLIESAIPLSRPVALSTKSVMPVSG